MDTLNFTTHATQREYQHEKSSACAIDFNLPRINRLDVVHEVGCPLAHDVLNMSKGRAKAVALISRSSSIVMTLGLPDRGLVFNIIIKVKSENTRLLKRISLSVSH